MAASSKVAVALMAVGAIGVVAVAAYVKGHPHALVPPSIDSPMSAPHVNQKEPPDASQFIVYLPKMGANGLTFSTSTVAAQSAEDLPLQAGEAFLAESHIVGPKARLLGVDVEDGLAHLSFNPEFNVGYGSFEESMLIKGFAAEMGQFPNIDHLVFEIGGKQLKTIGSVDLSDPIPVIRKADIVDGVVKDEDQPTATAGSNEAP